VGGHDLKASGGKAMWRHARQVVFRLHLLWSVVSSSCSYRLLLSVYCN